jgi:hypothetical protein
VDEYSTFIYENFQTPINDRLQWWGKILENGKQTWTNDVSPTLKQAVGSNTKVPFIFENKSPANVQNQKLQNMSSSEILYKRGVSSILEGAPHWIKSPAGTYSIDLAPLQMWNPKMERDH